MYRWFYDKHGSNLPMSVQVPVVCLAKFAKEPDLGAPEVAHCMSDVDMTEDFFDCICHEPEFFPKFKEQVFNYNDQYNHEKVSYNERWTFQDNVWRYCNQLKDGCRSYPGSNSDDPDDRLFQKCDESTGQFVDCEKINPDGLSEDVPLPREESDQICEMNQ